MNGKTLTILSFLIILNNLPTLTAERFNCEYEVSHWSHSEPVYMCVVENFEIFNQERVTIEGANGEHFINYTKDMITFKNLTDDDVKAVGIFKAENMHYFPRNIERVFKNLIWLSAHRSNLKEIRQSDVKVYPLLKYLYLDNNQIQYLEADLFKFNPELKLLWIDNNPYKHIDSLVFSSLRNLRNLRIGSCSNQERFPNADDSASEVLEVIGMVESGLCRNESFVTTTTENIIVSTTEIPAKVSERRHGMRNATIVVLVLAVACIVSAAGYVLVKKYFNGNISYRNFIA